MVKDILIWTIAGFVFTAGCFFAYQRATAIGFNQGYDYARDEVTNDLNKLYADCVARKGVVVTVLVGERLRTGCGHVDFEEKAETEKELQLKVIDGTI